LAEVFSLWLISIQAAIGEQMLKLFLPNFWIDFSIIDFLKVYKNLKSIFIKSNSNIQKVIIISFIGNNRGIKNIGEKIMGHNLNYVYNKNSSA
jgi:hypothetical protein